MATIMNDNICCGEIPESSTQLSTKDQLIHEVPLCQTDKATQNEAAAHEDGVSTSKKDEINRQPLTHALEVLLGGLGIPSLVPEEAENNPMEAVVHGNNPSTNIKEFNQTNPEKNAQNMASAVSETISVCQENTSTGIIEILPANNTLKPRVQLNFTESIDSAPSTGNETQNSTALPVSEESIEKPNIPGLFLCGSNFASGKAPCQENLLSEACVKDNISNPPKLDDFLALSLPNPHFIETSVRPASSEEQIQEQHPEYEADSSPIVSSSEDSSSESDSSEESEDEADSYKLLSPEEQARILMAGDGGSDDEGGDKSKSSGGQLRTKNEIPEVVIPRPDVVITQDMPIIELGVVEQIIDNVLLIKANTSGEYRVLESGSILCLLDRRVFGVVAETIGRVEQPFYSVLFTNSVEILALGISMGIKVFYSERHSTYVFTKSLKVFKGSDASNMNDEEVGEDEVEFSDDEMEAEHKRRVKQKRMGKREGKFQTKAGPNCNPHSLQQMSSVSEKNSVQSISYDEDEPYKPLTRPIGYAEHVSQNEAPLDNAYTGDNERQYSKGQPKSRSRGERRKARGDNGRTRGDRNSRTSKAPLPTKEPYQQSYGQTPAPRPQTSSLPHSHDDNIVMQNITPQYPFYPLPQSTSSSVQPQENLSHQIASQPHMQPHLQSHPQAHMQPHLQPHLQLWSQIFSQQGSQQPPQNTNQNWTNLIQSLPTGGYINPAFFNTQNGLSQPWKPPNHQNPSNSQGN